MLALSLRGSRAAGDGTFKIEKVIGTWKVTGGGEYREF
jgi:hypothetical protein